jgi:hypothetical protein
MKPLMMVHGPYVTHASTWRQQVVHCEISTPMLITLPTAKSSPG